MLRTAGWTYDGDGRVTQATSPQGRTTTNTYDGIEARRGRVAGNVDGVARALGSYQLAGSAVVGTDARHAVVRATLSAVNRRIEALLP